jgi:magnesium transporter
MVKKRAGWLTVLFVGEMFTVAAAGRYEHEMGRFPTLGVLIPLIISSGGNAGSQASTLVIRAMALGEARLTDWVRVLRREVLTGTLLGVLLGLVGTLRIVIAESVFPSEIAEHALMMGATVGISVVGVVLWGTVTGAMLPIVLRRCGFDPASASAPLVATFVDVTGVLLYFTVASTLLAGTLL